MYLLLELFAQAEQEVTLWKRPEVGILENKLIQFTWTYKLNFVQNFI